MFRQIFLKENKAWKEREKAAAKKKRKKNEKKFNCHHRTTIKLWSHQLFGNTVVIISRLRSLVHRTK